MTSPAIEKENVAPMEVVNTSSVTKKPAAKRGKTKKAKEVKKSVAAAPRKKSVSTHPTYEVMIKDAIATLKERTGSSQYAIQKFIEEKHKVLSPSFRKLLLLNLKRLVASEKLTKVKASFKIPSTKPSSPKPAAAPEKKKKKPTTTAAAASKPKGKVTTAAKVSKKPKATVTPKKKAVKAKERPAKAAKTSKVTSPGKKAVPAKKKAPVMATKKKTPVKKSVKPKTVKSPMKRAASRKAKK